jgi:hypothetical protein
VKGRKMPLCQSVQVLLEVQQRTTAANKTLLGTGMRRRRTQEKRKEGLISGRGESGGQSSMTTAVGTGAACCRYFVRSANSQSKKAVLAGSGPDPKTASKKRFSV